MLNFKRLKLDYYLLFLISLIAITSLFAIYSSDSINMNVSGMALRQGVWFLISVCVLVMINLTGNNFFIKYAHYFYIIGNALLLYLLFFGPVINNARCWFRIPGIGTIQVSEFMKICLILMGSKFIATTRFKNNFKEEMWFIIKLGLIFLIPSILTFLEPDTGAVLMYIVIYITLLFSSKLRLRYFLIIGFILIHTHTQCGKKPRQTANHDNVDITHPRPGDRKSVV